MEKLNESLNELKVKLKENKNLDKDEWNEYAKVNSYYSSVTLEAHLNVKDWSELKRKIFHSILEKNVNRQIEVMRRKLHKSIEITGLNSEETKKLYDEIHILINQYYKDNRDTKKGRYYRDKCFMDYIYNKSYQQLKKLTVEISEFPSVQIWNEYAKKNNYLNSQSIQYISRYELA